jgi:hypothetical protein
MCPWYNNNMIIKNNFKKKKESLKQTEIIVYKGPSYLAWVISESPEI